MAPDLLSYSLLDLYRNAKNFVNTYGYGWEIDCQRSKNFSNFSEDEFIREAAWVILCSGFKENVVRKCFDYISLCFCDWESALEIYNNRQACLLTALLVFRNEKKLNAIIKIAKIINEIGFSSFKNGLQDDPIQRLQELPYIGPITSWHLAKNLGFNVAKNDRHLQRMAHNWGYSDAHSFCQVISELTSEPNSVVDVVLWRYATLNSGQ